MLPALRNIYCLGRSYAEHARELGNSVDVDPLIFMKPRSSVVGEGAVVSVPADLGELHHEVELALLIGAAGFRVDEARAASMIAGYAVAIDLTLRELQNELKAQRRPWEPAKAFSGSCPLSVIKPADELGSVDDLQIRLWVNDDLRQDSRTSAMMLSTAACIVRVSRYFALEPGDLILTGTPAGVGPIPDGARLRGQVEGVGEISLRITRGAVTS